MLLIRGTSPFSPASANKQLTQLQSSNPGVVALTAEYVHFVDSDGKLSDGDLTVLNRLLQYGPTASSTDDQGSESVEVVVVPRAGTISPWSSKASDIAKIFAFGESISRLPNDSEISVLNEMEYSDFWCLLGKKTLLRI